MPRKLTGERLEKVVSTKISVDDFILLEKYARIRYNENLIVQPTISHLLRWIVKRWAKVIREQEMKSTKRRDKPSQEESIEHEYTPQKKEVKPATNRDKPSQEKVYDYNDILQGKVSVDV
ncbi:MAG: hypothetical protein M3530_05100 [Thermoproteota archaeon]|nr:hypothetical protein [Thermoproteota archaeon]